MGKNGVGGSDINESPVNSLQKQQKTVRDANGRWRPGRSGNPRGRPVGARGRANLLAEAIAADDSGALKRLVVEYALDGDVPALQYCLKRLLRRRRREPPLLDLPPIATRADAALALAEIVAAAARGDILPADARRLARQVERKMARPRN